MKKYEIGKSGIAVPYVCLGTWAVGGGRWWGDSDDEMSIRAIREAVEQGIEWIDTAPVYGLGHSERVVGKAIHDIRDKVILSTKCTLVWDHETSVFHKPIDGIPVYRDHSRKAIIEDVERSLERLNTDYIDILYTHWQTTDRDAFPIEETVDALMELKRAGKIRAIGASNVSKEDIEDYCRLGDLDVIQEKYSLMTQRVKDELYPTADRLGVSIQAYTPLEHGLLTGKVTMDSVYDEGSIRNFNPQFTSERRRLGIELMEKWRPLAEKYGCSLSSLVIAMTHIALPGSFVLCGSRKIEHVKDNADALRLELDPADVSEMLKDIETLK